MHYAKRRLSQECKESITNNVKVKFTQLENIVFSGMTFQEVTDLQYMASWLQNFKNFQKKKLYYCCHYYVMQNYMKTILSQGSNEETISQ